MFLHSIRSTLALLLTFPILAVGQRDFSSVEYTTTDLGNGIYMLEGSGGNIGVSVGQDGVFVIDSQFGPLTPKLLAAIGKISDQSVRFLINTHHHGDHTGGNANLAEAGAVVVAHDNVRQRMSSGNRQRASEGALPVITFSDTTTFFLNGHEIHAFHVANAHTDGDAIIYFKDLDIIHTGDTMFNGMYPFIDLNSGGSVDGFIKAQKAIASLAGENTVIIPGHGPLAKKSNLEKCIAMLEEAKGRIQKQVSADKSLKEVQDSDVLADLTAVWGGGFMSGERFTEILYNDIAK